MNSPTPEPNTFTHESYVMNRLYKMSDARSNQDYDKYYALFIDVLQSLMHVYHSMNPKKAKDLEDDFETLQRIKKEIYNDEKLNDNAKKQKVNDLMYDFCFSHSYYIYKALNKFGIIKLAQDGIIDFNSVDIETLQKITNSQGSGLIKSIQKNIGENSGSDGI